MRMETFIRKALRLKAHRVVKVEEDEGAGELTVHLDRVGERRLRCGVCGRAARRVAGTRRPERRWRDLAMREHLVQLVYAPHRVWCQVCGLRVERVPWADTWQTVGAVVEGAVLWGLAHRRWEPLHVLGLDEVSRRKGQQYLTVVYDLARGRVIWVGRDR